MKRTTTPVIKSVELPQAFLETIVQESLKVPARVWTATCEGLLEDDSSGELDKIKAPTLIVWGDQDALLPRSDQEALAAAISGSRLIVYPGAGHAFYWEEPDRVASDLVAFIEDLGEGVAVAVPLDGYADQVMNATSNKGTEPTC